MGALRVVAVAAASVAMTLLASAPAAAAIRRRAPGGTSGSSLDQFAVRYYRYRRRSSFSAQAACVYTLPGCASERRRFVADYGRYGRCMAWGSSRSELSRAAEDAAALFRAIEHAACCTTAAQRVTLDRAISRLMSASLCPLPYTSLPDYSADAWVCHPLATCDDLKAAIVADFDASGCVPTNDEEHRGDTSDAIAAVATMRVDGCCSVPATRARLSALLVDVVTVPRCAALVGAPDDRDDGKDDDDDDEELWDDRQLLLPPSPTGGGRAGRRAAAVVPARRRGAPAPAAADAASRKAVSFEVGNSGLTAVDLPPWAGGGTCCDAMTAFEDGCCPAACTWVATYTMNVATFKICCRRMLRSRVKSCAVLGGLWQFP